MFVTRTGATSPFNTSMPTMAALAARYSKTASSYEVTRPAGGTLPAVITSTIQLASEESVAVIIGEAESRGPGLRDPTSVAVGLTLSADSRLVAERNLQAFDAFWSKSSISLPGREKIEKLWYGTLYALYSSSSNNSSDVAPGLYGPWATRDKPRRNGDA